MTHSDWTTSPLGTFVALAAQQWGRSPSSIGEVVALFYEAGSLKRAVAHWELSPEDRQRRQDHPDAYGFLEPHIMPALESIAALEFVRIVCWRRSSLAERTADRLADSCAWIELQPALRQLGLPAISLSQTAAHLGIRHLPDAGTGQQAEMLAEIFFLLVEANEWTNWADFSAAATRPPDFSGFSFDQNYLDSLPASPGVYLMKDQRGEILYIGKSSNLQRRVCSYFLPGATRLSKILKLHSRLHAIDVWPLGSALEATLVEARLIRTLRPIVNMQLEVHEPQVAYLQQRDLIIVCPSARARMELFLIRAGELVEQISIPERKRSWSGLEKRIGAVYFANRRRKQQDRQDTYVLNNFLKLHCDRINSIDIARYASASQIIETLQHYHRDSEALKERVIFQ